MTKALLIPAYSGKPPVVVDLGDPSGHLAKLQELVYGFIERFQYDEAVDSWVNENGRSDGFPLNRRATKYILAESDRFKRGETRGNEEWFSVYGNVVMTGPADEDGNITDVPEATIAKFGALPDQSMGAEL